jgi:alcohol dehydrogenase class IV
MEGPARVNWLDDFQFGPMSRVVFGAGRAREAGQIARELDGTTALVMTDPVLHRLALLKKAY